MENIIETLNKLMLDFQKHWERENTNEMFILLNGSNDTQELQLDIQKNYERLSMIEDMINEESNFETLVEHWNSIDLKLLDNLYQTFEINIEAFVTKINSTEDNKDIKEFLVIQE